MEPAVIVVTLLLGLYTAALLYLNAKVKLGDEPPKGDERGVEGIGGLLKTGVSAVGIMILCLLCLMVLLAALLAYSFFFDPDLIFPR